jgi:hypothetical protein
MSGGKGLLCVIGFILALGSAAGAQQTPEAVPNESFKTVHLMIVAPAQEAGLVAAVHDFNRDFAEQGCPSCAYRLFKVFAGKDENYNYLMTSDWPSRDVYLKIHVSAAFNAVVERNPIMSSLYETEFYGRYAEVK